MMRRQGLLCLLLPSFCSWLWNSNLLYRGACWITLFTDLWWPENANFLPQALLWAVSRMQAGWVLGETSLGSMNKGQHFIWTRGMHFPYILELCVCHKSRFISKLSPQSCLHSLAWVWIEYSFCSLYFFAQQFFPKMTEGCSGDRPVIPCQLIHKDYGISGVPTQLSHPLFFLRYVLLRQLSLWVWVLILLLRSLCWRLEEQICISYHIKASRRNCPLIF